MINVIAVSGGGKGKSRVFFAPAEATTSTSDLPGRFGEEEDGRRFYMQGIPERIQSLWNLSGQLRNNLSKSKTSLSFGF